MIHQERARGVQKHGNDNVQDQRTSCICRSSGSGKMENGKGCVGP